MQKSYLMDDQVLVDDSLENSVPTLEGAIALISQLSPADQHALLKHLAHQTPPPLPEGNTNQVLVDDRRDVSVYPLGQKSLAASGWKQEKRVLKERRNGSQDAYIEYWFNCEIWSVKEQQWKHKSCYICQHPEGRPPSTKAARKLELLDRQLANKRPYPETLTLLNKHHKLEQWESEHR